MLEHAPADSQSDYDAAFEMAAVVLQVAGDVDIRQGYSFAQRAHVLDAVASETTTAHSKQEVLDQVAAITQDPIFLKASVRYAKKQRRLNGLRHSA